LCNCQSESVIPPWVKGDLARPRPSSTQLSQADHFSATVAGPGRLLPITFIISRLVNIGIGTDIDTLSAILSQYRYGQYFCSGVSGVVSPILFWLIFADIRYQYNQKKKYNFLFNS